MVLGPVSQLGYAGDSIEFPHLGILCLRLGFVDFSVVVSAVFVTTLFLVLTDLCSTYYYPQVPWSIYSAWCAMPTVTTLTLTGIRLIPWYKPSTSR